MPALDEDELDAARERIFELLSVAGDREARIVRREHEADDGSRAGRESALCGVGDAGRPVLHAGEDGDLLRCELTRERSASGFGDRVEWVRVLDAEAAVALDEILEVLRRDRAPAADVAVVRRHVGEPLGRAVRHQDNRGRSH